MAIHTVKKSLAIVAGLLQLIAHVDASYSNAGNTTTTCSGASTGTTIPPTGTVSPSLSTCPSTITAYITTTATVTSTATEVLNEASRSILGDDFVPDICIPQTFTYVSQSASRLDATTTVTQIDVFTFTSGTTGTVTIPPRSGFLPIQDTLPGATYARRLGGANPLDDPEQDSPSRRDARAQRAPNNQRRGAHGLNKRFANETCSDVTITQITTYTTTLASTSTITLTGDVVLCPFEGTYYQASEVATFFTTTTVVVPTPSYATTSTLTISTSTTVTPSPVEIYAACATNNFADSIITGNGSVVPIRYTRITVSSLNATSAYDCCAATVEQPDLSTWLWSTYSGCYAVYNEYCPSLGNVTVYYGGDGNDEGPDDERVVGNADCGFAGSAKYGPAVALTYPFLPPGETL